MFDMDIADPVPFLLTTYMADKRGMWDAIVKRENLRPIPYGQIVAWSYGDFAFRQDFDNVSSTIKVRQAGFHDRIDSETMFSEIYENLREMRILPRLPGSVSPAIPAREVSTFDSQRKVSWAEARRLVIARMAVTQPNSIQAVGVPSSPGQPTSPD
jgi:hypothetical protein